MFKRFSRVGWYWGNSEGEVFNAKRVEGGVESVGGVFLERFIRVAQFSAGEIQDMSLYRKWNRGNEGSCLYTRGHFYRMSGGDRRNG